MTLEDHAGDVVRKARLMKQMEPATAAVGPATARRVVRPRPAPTGPHPSANERLRRLYFLVGRWPAERREVRPSNPLGIRSLPLRQFAGEALGLFQHERVVHQEQRLRWHRRVLPLAGDEARVGRVE